MTDRPNLPGVGGGPSAEALASIPAENERRARLYDALWDLAYRKGPVQLAVVGTHDTVYRLALYPRMDVALGTLAEVEAVIESLASDDNE